jgi:tetratricopeptide (TPR) repeat protein
LLELTGSGAQDSYYNLLVRGFRNGHLYVDREAPPELVQGGGSANLDWSQIHGVHDLSYYKGKLYTYFGITPALALFWPYEALTGRYLLQRDAVLIFTTAGFLAGAGLLCAIWRRYFKETGFGAMAAGTLALGLANFAPVLLGRCDVYEVPISCGYALTMLALAGIWGALHDTRHRRRWLAAASLAYGLALGSRPSLLFGAVILLVPVAQEWREKRAVWPLLLAAGGPIVLIGLGLMAYNALRFDNPLEFGQRYQLPVIPQQLFRLRYFWFNFQVGFLDPARWNGHFPFVHDIALPPQPKGYLYADNPFGVLTNIPLVWLALAAPLAWRIRPPEARSILRWFLGAAALLFVMIALPLVLYDDMALRYEIEYTAPLILLAVVGVHALERALAGQPAWRRAARCGWILLLAFSVGFNMLASFETQAQAQYTVGRDLLLTDKPVEGFAHLEKAMELEPDDMEIHSRLGSDLLLAGRVDEAITQLQEGLQLRPDNMEAHYNLGGILQRKGRVDEAISQYQLALQIWPDYAEAHISLGNALLQQGRVDEAIPHFQKGLQLKPGYTAIHRLLGNALLQQGRVDEAISQFQTVLQLDPGSPDAHNNLAFIFLNHGRLAEAITQYQTSLQMKPDQADALNNLAALLATASDPSLRNGSNAVALALKADQLSGGGNPMYLRTLAAAYAEEGNYALAAATARRALELAAAQKQDALAASLQQEIINYEANAPPPDAPR